MKQIVIIYSVIVLSLLSILSCENTVSSNQQRDYIVSVNNASKLKIDSVVLTEIVVTGTVVDSIKKTYLAHELGTVDHGEAGYSHEINLVLQGDESSLVTIEYTMYSYGVPFYSKNKHFTLGGAVQKTDVSQYKLLGAAMGDYQIESGGADTTNIVLLREIFVRYMVRVDNENPDVFYVAYINTPNTSASELVNDLVLKKGGGFLAMVEVTNMLPEGIDIEALLNGTSVAGTGVPENNSSSSTIPVSSIAQLDISSNGVISSSSSALVVSSSSTDPDTLSSSSMRIVSSSSSTLVAPSSSSVDESSSSVLTFNVSMEFAIGGFVIADGSTYTNGSQLELAPLQAATIIAVPETGYTFSHWEASVAELTIGNTKLTTTSLVASAHGVLKAVFMPINRKIIFLTTDNYGAVSLDGTELTSSFDFIFGTSVILQSTADFGYAFSSWESSNITITNDKHAVTEITNVTAASSTLKAIYEPVTYAVPSDVVGGEGTINFSGNYTFGTTETLSVIPDFGYTFSNWNVVGVVIAANTESTTITGITSEIASVSVELLPLVYSIPTTTVGVDGTIDFDGLYTYGTTEQIVAKPAEGNVFVRWEASNVIIDDSTRETANITSVSTGSDSWDIRAVFEDAIGTFTDVRDGQKYKSTIIGGQTWMAENLNFTTAASVCYDNLPLNCDQYGALYYADDAETNACPAGWTVPTYDDWNIFSDYLEEYGGGYDYDNHDNDCINNFGEPIKSTTGWSKFNYNMECLRDFDESNMVDGNGTNSLDFSAIPSGWKHSAQADYYIRKGSEAHYWASTEIGNNFNRTFIVRESHYARGSSGSRDYALSVRCIKE
ncbi:MAG: hypothetical protein OCC49_01240 [Fibrobacterales bacterium]